MEFGDGVWSASVTGSVLSQAPAGFLWKAEGVMLVQRQGGSLKSLVVRWMLRVVDGF